MSDPAPVALAVFEAIPIAINSVQAPLSLIKYSFLSGLALFVILLPFCRSYKSFYDAVAAKRVLSVVRILIMIEAIFLIILLYYVIKYGSPLQLHALLELEGGTSWLYSYGRPVSGILLITIGMMGEMHPIPRLVCIFGCFYEICLDSLSAVQVQDYYHQLQTMNAPSGLYSEQSLLYYYYRDIISIGLCSAILFFVSHLTCILGFCHPQLIPLHNLSGGEYDRAAVMREHREYRISNMIDDDIEAN